MRVGGIVLCGGQSRRMGSPKATLPFGDEVLLTRMLRLLAQVVDPLLVVAAPTQLLPDLPVEIDVVRDRSEGRGPLEGLYCGLRHLSDRAEAAYVTGCDTPLLRPQFVQFMMDQLGTHDVVVPVDGEFHHPLAAVYRTRIADTIADLLARDQLRMVSFYEQVATKCLEVARLRHVDPELHSLLNMNCPEDYQRALRLAGYGCR